LITGAIMNPRYIYDNEDEYLESQLELQRKRYYEEQQMIHQAEQQFNEFFLDKLENRND